jgi:branched-chain amino acid transport system substrate-binding protein
MRIASAAALIVCALFVAPSHAQKRYGPGATDAEIKIGNIMPYTGGFSEYGAIGRAESAYFRMINDRGGINGRKINFVSVDYGSDITKFVAFAHDLVEREGVLLLVSTWGAPTNAAIRAYMNEKEVPQLFVADTDSANDDPTHYPWTMGFQVSKRVEASVYAKYILQNKPGAKIAVLYSADPSGEQWLLGLREGLGERASTLIVKALPFEYARPGALESQIAELKDSGADVFMNLTIGRFATQAIRTAYDTDWHPLQFIPNASLSNAAFLDPAAVAKAAGIISNARSKGWLSPQSQHDPAVQEFLEWMRRYLPDTNIRDANNVYGYEVAQTLIEVFKNCGDDLTRANVMKQAAHLDLALGMLRPGIRITTSPTDYRPIKQLYLVRFDGKEWQRFGEIVGN